MHGSVTGLYYCLFYFMENQLLLDPLNELHIFALCYVYFPRINRALHIFRQGWNHHGIRTANNYSPHQLFVSGALRLHSSGICALDFLSNVPETYGIDPDETHISLPEDGRVSVPECRFTITEADQQRLRQVNPLADSENYGIELYEQVVDMLQ